MIEIPVWLILTFFAALFLISILSFVAIYYLASKKYSNISLIISAVIFTLFLIYVLAIVNRENPSETIYLAGMPFSLLSGLNDEIAHSDIVFCSVGLVLNYLSIFSIVNFIYRVFK